MTNEHGISGKRYPVECQDVDGNSRPIEAKFVTIQILPPSCYHCETDFGSNVGPCRECYKQKNILQISEIELKVKKCDGKEK